VAAGTRPTFVVKRQIAITEESYEQRLQNSSSASNLVHRVVRSWEFFYFWSCFSLECQMANNNNWNRSIPYPWLRDAMVIQQATSSPVGWSFDASSHAAPPPPPTPEDPSVRGDSINISFTQFCEGLLVPWLDGRTVDHGFSRGGGCHPATIHHHPVCPLRDQGFLSLVHKTGFDFRFVSRRLMTSPQILHIAGWQACEYTESNQPFACYPWRAC
jgi:hypothetical protein